MLHHNKFCLSQNSFFQKIHTKFTNFSKTFLAWNAEKFKIFGTAAHVCVHIYIAGVCDNNRITHLCCTSICTSVSIRMCRYWEVQ